MKILYWLAVGLIASGGGLLILTRPSLFFTAMSGGFFDWTEGFWYVQWLGFWLVATGLALSTLAAASLRMALAPAIAAALCVWFLAASMPEKSNQSSWAKGDLGLGVYVRTKRWLKAESNPAMVPALLAGAWRDGEARTFRFEPATVHAGGDPFGNVRYEMLYSGQLMGEFYDAGINVAVLFASIPSSARRPAVHWSGAGREGAAVALNSRLMIGFERIGRESRGLELRRD